MVGCYYVGSWWGGCWESDCWRSDGGVFVSLRWAPGVELDWTDSLSLTLRYSIEHLRDLRAFFGTTFKIKEVIAGGNGVVEAAEEEEEEDEMMNGPKADKAQEFVLSCVGTGYTNVAKRT